MSRFEVLGRKDSQDQIHYLGQVDAPNPEMGLIEARQCFSRRGEVDELWLIESGAIRRFRREGDEGLDHSYREIQSYADLGRRRRLVEANLPATQLTEEPTLSSSGPDLDVPGGG
jgi:ring-1,2-phenylacetyl-CoA epoxidase subunit PaaB